MSEYPNEDEQLTNPKPSGQASGDDNYRGDIGDQGNDLRFAEEQELIREQASPASVKHDEGEYTDADGRKQPPASSHSAAETEGSYTDSEGTQD